MTDEPARLHPHIPMIVESVHPALIHAVDWASEHESVEFMEVLAAYCAGWDARGREEANGDS
jgi:hypothetical protein